MENKESIKVEENLVKLNDYTKNLAYDVIAAKEKKKANFDPALHKIFFLFIQQPLYLGPEEILDIGPCSSQQIQLEFLAFRLLLSCHLHHRLRAQDR